MPSIHNHVSWFDSFPSGKEFSHVGEIPQRILAVNSCGSCGHPSTGSRIRSASFRAVPHLRFGLSCNRQCSSGGGTQQFTATVHNDWHHHGVRWTLSGAGCSGSTCGTLSATTSASGAPLTYTAPPNVPNPATVTLTASSVSSTSKKASANITVTGSSTALSVTIAPKRGGLRIAQTLPVTAT